MVLISAIHSVKVRGSSTPQEMRILINSTFERKCGLWILLHITLVVLVVYTRMYAYIVCMWNVHTCYMIPGYVHTRIHKTEHVTPVIAILIIRMSRRY